MVTERAVMIWVMDLMMTSSQTRVTRTLTPRRRRPWTEKSASRWSRLAAQRWRRLGRGGRGPVRHRERGGVSIREDLQDQEQVEAQPQGRKLSFLFKLNSVKFVHQGWGHESEWPGVYFQEAYWWSWMVILVGYSKRILSSQCPRERARETWTWACAWQ